MSKHEHKSVCLPGKQVLLNVVLAVAYATLLGLLVLSIYSNPALVPHVVVLLILATGLWLSINWFISNIGLTDPKQQQQQLLGAQHAKQGTEEQQTEGSQEAPDKKRT
jgi:hypothetical protein